MITHTFHQSAFRALHSEFRRCNACSNALLLRVIKAFGDMRVRWRSLAPLLSSAAVVGARVSFPLCLSSSQATCSAASAFSTMATNYKQPSVFVPHGGGPMPLMNEPSHRAMIKWLTNFQRDFVTTKPAAIVLVTAHWEGRVTQITSSAAPELFYDYYGFPPEAYQIKYPAPGHPELAARIQKLLASQNIPSQLDAKRGYDHGVFIPLNLMFPKADIPVVQMSIYASFDPESHIKLGEALRSLREENIIIIGSGLTYHSSKYPRGRANEASVPFHDYLRAALVENTDPVERRRRLQHWTDAPYARGVQPREDHLMPLLVAAGAGLEEPCEEIFYDEIFHALTSGYLFGERS